MINVLFVQGWTYLNSRKVNNVDILVPSTGPHCVKDPFFVQKLQKSWIARKMVNFSFFGGNFEWSYEVRAKREPSSEMSHSKTSIRFFSCKILGKNLPTFVAFPSQNWITKGSYAIWYMSIMESSCKNLGTFPDLLLFLPRVVAYFKGLCHT